MSGLSAEADAFIRPSPSAGTLGGVARKTRESMLVCEAAGYQIVLIETVGVGQSETMVADMTDCFVALMLPGAGDELQGIKRGLLEMVDIIVVNKADGETRRAAEVAAQQYSIALKSIAARRDGEDEPEVLTCSALCHQNVETVWDAIRCRHARWQASGELSERRRQQNLRWLWSMVQEHLRQAVQTHPKVRAIRATLEQDVLSGVIPPETAAREILQAFGMATGEIAQQPT
jgi:LAO/AO transport system kinase